MADLELVSYVKLSLQRALLGNVTPNIRAVVVEIEEKKLHCFFILMVRLMVTMKSLPQW